jgi:hypothetical protein
MRVSGNQSLILHIGRNNASSGLLDYVAETASSDGSMLGRLLNPNPEHLLPFIAASVEGDLFTFTIGPGRYNNLAH